MTWGTVLALACASGCDAMPTIYTCPDPSEKCGDPTACTGACITRLSDGWRGPALLWTGPHGEAPPCPEQAPVRAYDGLDGLTDQMACAACSCGPPTGTCGLPTAMFANDTPCPPAGATVVRTAFDPPPSWDGSCTSNHPVAAGKTCNGVPCVQSLTIGPLSLAEQPCAPAILGEQIKSLAPAATWSTSARACVASEHARCAADQACSPEPPHGFASCVFQEGAVDCPNEWPERHVFYDGADDSRTCTECSCGAPVGGVCTAFLSVYKDDQCSAVVEGQIGLDSSSPMTCHDIVPQGSALGSKQITNVVYHPGACEPRGGEVSGTIGPMGPMTFCCKE